ncbi:hypothetical protein [Aeoliella sp.]|uniref:hypothetical protein n=1 Tax=Aeoliella sp. TaxID=2795800 RepID=UPI003CCBDA7B
MLRIPAAKVAFRWSSLKSLGLGAWARLAFVWIILVPIAAKFLSAIKSPVEVDFGGDAILLNFELPFSWKMFYFGAIAFTVGRWMFQYRCPPLIRDYDTFDDYRRIGRGEEHLRDEFFRLAVYDSDVVAGSFYHDRNKQLINFLSRYVRGELVGRYGSMIQWQFPPGTLFVPIPKDSATGDDDFVPIVASTATIPPDTKAGLLTIKIDLGKASDVACLRLHEEAIAPAFWFAREVHDSRREGSRLFCTVCYLVGFILFGWVSIEAFISVIRMV